MCIRPTSISENNLNFNFQKKLNFTFSGTEAALLHRPRRSSSPICSRPKTAPQLSSVAFYSTEFLMFQYLQYAEYCGFAAFWLNAQSRLSMSQTPQCILLQLFSGCFRFIHRPSSLKTTAKVTTAVFRSSHSAPLSLVPTLSLFFNPFILNELHFCHIRPTRRSWQERCAERPSTWPAPSPPR